MEVRLWHEFVRYVSLIAAETCWGRAPLPRVALAKPRFTLGVMLSRASRADARAIPTRRDTDLTVPIAH